MNIDENDDYHYRSLPLPHYVVVEEHHHIIPHIIGFVHEYILSTHGYDPEEDVYTNAKFDGYDINDEFMDDDDDDDDDDDSITAGTDNDFYIPIPDTNRNGDGAILIHIDSHADMGLTPGLNTLFTAHPAQHHENENNVDRENGYPIHHNYQSLMQELPKTKSGIHGLVRHTRINDFLLLLGYMGILDHIIFIEPPWSILLREAHDVTTDISMCVVVTNQNNNNNYKLPEAATYATITQSTDSIKPLTDDAFQAIKEGMDDDDEVRFKVVLFTMLLCLFRQCLSFFVLFCSLILALSLYLPLSFFLLSIDTITISM